ncbi:MAG TPA: cbb3-type cytochrome oxidase assembly protein CcoS [Rubrivivax sp.]|nr:cbb3-type cytochrome oxidase assembly protein CcoS [Rubrivivax sp.]
MDILYLLIPLSTALVLLILGVFAWALHRNQFEDLEREGQRILQDEPARLDADQTRALQPTDPSSTMQKAARGGASWQ